MEDLALSDPESFDAVVASEIVEHVSDLSIFIGACCALVKVSKSLGNLILFMYILRFLYSLELI